MAFHSFHSTFVTLVTFALAGCANADLASDSPPATKAESTEPGEDSETPEAEAAIVDEEAPADAGTADIFSGVDDTEPEAAQPVGPDLGLPAESDATSTNMANAKVQELTERVVEMQTEMQELKNNYNSLKRQYDDLEKTLYAVQGSIAESEDSSLISERALGAMAENPALRTNLVKMLQGKVRLVNNTGADVVVYINGTAWTVLTGDSYVLAPVGTVSFLRQGETTAQFASVDEWKKNPTSGQFELVYNLSGSATEQSVMKKTAP